MREYLTEEEWQNLTPDLVVKAILRIDHDLRELTLRKQALANEIAEVRKRLIDLNTQMRETEQTIKAVRQQKTTLRMIYYNV